MGCLIPVRCEPGQSGCEAELEQTQVEHIMVLRCDLPYGAIFWETLK